MSENSNRRSALSTVLVMGCTLISRILGFVRTAAIGALFGAGGVADVINLVFNIPNNLRKLLAEGALSTAFIPELSREITQDPTGNGSRRLAQSILGLQTVIIIPILLFSLFFPAQVLFIFEKFDDPAKKELSVVLFRWIMPYLLLVSVSAVMMAVHNTHDRFFIPAATPIIFSICVISSLVLGYQRWGAVSIGFGVLFGGVAQILVQYPTFRGLGYALTPSFGFREPAFKRVMRKWAPMLLTSSLFAINNQVAMLLASFLPDKSTSSLAYAIVFFQLPFGIFSASITTVLYPKMSRQAVQGDQKGFLSSLGFGYRNLWALLVPSAMALILLGEPIVAIAFQRRAFTFNDTILTARVLAAYSVGMPFIGLFNITQRSLYALGEVRKPFYCALATVAVDIILSVVFVFVADGSSVSLAWANSFAFIFGSILQFVVMRRKSGFRIQGETLQTFAKVLAGTGAGALVILTSYRILGADWWETGSSWSGLGLLIITAVITSGVILGLYGWMKVEAVSIILNRGGREINEDS
ncbi:MAG: murein biosynthesis integral membrane protein MurJ [Spirochaetaceae bacterium]|nr:murein biosynthesis integral membrane protein MurJ [Spirochaetaceae bacterium]